MFLSLLTEFCDQNKYILKLEYWGDSCHEYDIELEPKYGKTMENTFYMDFPIYCNEVEIKEFIEDCKKQLQKQKTERFDKQFNLNDWESFCFPDKRIYYKMQQGGLSNYESVTVSVYGINKSRVEYFTTQEQFIKQIMQPLENKGFIWVAY